MDSSDFINLNSSHNSSHNSNFYYNSSQQLFSLTPVYQKDQLPNILQGIQSINEQGLDYLKKEDDFADYFKTKSKDLKLDDYAKEGVFVDLMMGKLNSVLGDNGKNELKREISKIDDPVDSLEILRKKNLNNLSVNSQLLHNFNDLNLEHENMNEYILEEMKEVSINTSQLKDNKRKALSPLSESDSESECEFTFRDLKNLDFEKLLEYRISNLELIPNLIPEFTWDYIKLITEFFKIAHNCDPIIILSNNLGKYCSKILINQNLIAEFETHSNSDCKEIICKLLMRYLCPKLALKLKQIKKSRKKIKENPQKNLLNNEKIPTYDEFNNFDNNNSFGCSELALDEMNIFNVIPLEEQMNPVVILESEIDNILKKKNFSFAGFLAEFKMEYNKEFPQLDRKELEKKTLYICLKTMENLFKFVNIQRKNKQNFNFNIYYTIYCYFFEGNFRCHIVKNEKNTENKKNIIVTKHSIKVFAIYSAFISFFQKELGGNFKSINEVFEEMKSENMKSDINNNKCRNLENLLNEIDNF